MFNSIFVILATFYIVFLIVIIRKYYSGGKRDMTMKKTKLFYIVEFLRKIREHMINAYFIVLKHVIPYKLVTIRYECPLDGCGTIINATLLTHRNDFTIDDIFGAIWKSTANHLDVEHHIKDFQGLEFHWLKSDQVFLLSKYRYTEPMKPAKTVEEPDLSDSENGGA